MIESTPQETIKYAVFSYIYVDMRYLLTLCLYCCGYQVSFGASADVTIKLLCNYNRSICDVHVLVAAVFYISS